MRVMAKEHQVYIFFINDTTTTEIYTLSLHDALPILASIASLIVRITGNIVGLQNSLSASVRAVNTAADHLSRAGQRMTVRSEEHTSELQSRQYLVCRLLLEKKYHPLSYSLIY